MLKNVTAITTAANKLDYQEGMTRHHNTREEDFPATDEKQSTSYKHGLFLVFNFNGFMFAF